MVTASAAMPGAAGRQSMGLGVTASAVKPGAVGRRPGALVSNVREE
jgi:hypothetical protein